MAYLFTKNIIEESPIKVFNHGNMERVSTYIADFAEGVYKLLDVIPQPNPDWDETKENIGACFAPYKIHFIGHNQPVQLNEVH